MIKKKLYAIHFKSIVCLFKRSLQGIITIKECVTVVIFFTCQVKIIAIFKLRPQKAKHKHTFKKKRKYIFKWEGAKIILLHASHERTHARTHTYTHTHPPTHTCIILKLSTSDFTPEIRYTMFQLCYLIYNNISK